MNIEGKKISIIGAVRSGIGAAKLAKKLGAIPFVSDAGDAEKLAESIFILRNENIEFECGQHTNRVYDCDFMITSPGVPSNSDVILKAALKNIKVVSEVEFASWFCKGTIIAITGTNGKTTTTTLVNYILNESGYKCYAAGNIGYAFSELALEVKREEFVALETSSFQLDHTENFKPTYSMILNITPDHLDRYENSFEKYIASKINITNNLDEKDFFIYNVDEPNSYSTVTNERVNKLGFSIQKEVDNGVYAKYGKMYYSKNGVIEHVCDTDDLYIKGEHNLANALAVLAVVKTIGLSNFEIKNAFSTFKGVEHRLEFVRELDGVVYINDSKATNVDSVWYALRSFDKPLYLILGGKDKGNNYDQIKELVKQNVKKVYAIGSSAEKVYEYFNSIVEVEKVDSMEECVQLARKQALAGTIVLLSPACASFDMFKNFEHRGEVFKNAVLSLA